MKPFEISEKNDANYKDIDEEEKDEEIYEELTKNIEKEKKNPWKIIAFILCILTLILIAIFIILLIIFLNKRNDSNGKNQSNKRRLEQILEDEEYIEKKQK